MKITQKEIVKILKPYIGSVILFVFTGFIFKTFETFLFIKYQDSASFWVILQSYFNITVSFCLYAIIILPLYLLMALVKQKPAQIIVSVIFALLASFELGLFIYYKMAGVLMGVEIVVRPISETLTTIRNSSNIFINASLLIILIAFFVTLPFFLKKVKIFHKPISVLISIFILCILSLCTIFYQSNRNKTINNFIESKSFYFYSALWNHLIYTHGFTEHSKFLNEQNENLIEKTEELLREYVKLFPQRTMPDLNYPMERPSSEFPDVLAPYFIKSDKQPNIVIIIVESLGSYLIGDKGNNVSFTPFIDSLAHTGLFWKNCLTTTPRTFGVVPAVLGSVPHGKRGFQFGIMPKHHSLFSILKTNNYKTNFFFGGDSNFDNMIDFLTLQEPDHIDNFMPQLKKYQKNDLANYWALYDHVLFDESLKFLKEQSNQKPNVNVFLTLTTHEPFYSGDQELIKIYKPKTEKIFSKLKSDKRKYFLPIKDIITTFTYLDDCLRNFMNNYSKQPDFDNTIFIITGDHSHGIYKNELAHYSVPLIIWSPLLKTSQTFPNIVSHLAITPSIISFLQNNYNLKVPENISWNSDGLDTASVFNPSEKLLFLNYERKVNTMVFNQYFFQQGRQIEDNLLFEIDENLDLKEVNDPKLIENYRSKFLTLKYVNDFVYHNNRLSGYDHGDKKYKVINIFENNDTIICNTPDTIPSNHGIDTFDIMPLQKFYGNYNKIKIKLMANIVINDFVYQDCQMHLNFICLGDNFRYISKENITKYIPDDNILCDKIYELFIEKEIDVSEMNKFSVHVCVTTNHNDYCWKPNKKITISNARVTIFGK